MCSSKRSLTCDFQVAVFVSRSSAEIRDHLKILQASKPSAIGLDAEWYTRFTPADEDPAADTINTEASNTQRKGKRSEGRLSILQLSSRDVCLVIQLEQAARADVIPSELRDLLSSASVIKAGVGIFEVSCAAQGFRQTHSVGWLANTALGSAGCKAVTARPWSRVSRVGGPPERGVEARQAGRLGVEGVGSRVRSGAEEGGGAGDERLGCASALCPAGQLLRNLVYSCV